MPLHPDPSPPPAADPPEITGLAVRTPVLTLTLACPTDPTPLDRWLADVLADPAPPSRLPPALPGAAVPAAQWVQRVLHLARHVLLIARVPSFDRPRLLALSPGPDADGRWSARVDLASADHLPTGLLAQVLQASADVALWCHAHPPAPDTAAALFERLQRQVLQPLTSQIPGGKSTLPLLQAAHALRIPWRHLGGGVYQLGWGARARYFDRSSVDGDSAAGIRLTQHKVLSARLLRDAGLPAPQHGVATQVEAAQAAASRLGWPVVVKPADRDRGEGVTVNVNDADALAAAFATARALARQGEVLIERQVAGVCHRLFLVQGHLLYAVKRLPMGLYGNGRDTVAQQVHDVLQREQTLPPWRRSGLQALDDLALGCLARAGLGPDSVPAAGHFVALRPIETTAWGGVDEDVTDQVHPDNLRIAATAARLVGLEIAGVDIMTTDIGRPWHETGAIINEVNYAPLLGGGEISRARIPALLRRLLPDQGRIPWYAGQGETAWHQAVCCWQAWRDEGKRAYLTSGTHTFGPDGAVVALALQGTQARVRALLGWPDVEALAWADAVDPPAPPSTSTAVVPPCPDAAQFA